MNTPNPLQELAEKLVVVIGDTDTDEQFIEKALPILTAHIGTLLQAERAATLANGAHSIRSTIFYREIDVLETRPFYLRDQIADCVEKQLPHPADASALSAVVQRETEKLREALKWTISICDDSVIFKSAFGDEICASCDTRLDMNGTKAPHKVDCPYVAAKAALQ